MSRKFFDQRMNTDDRILLNRGTYFFSAAVAGAGSKWGKDFPNHFRIGRLSGARSIAPQEQTGGAMLRAPVQAANSPDSFLISVVRRSRCDVPARKAGETGAVPTNQLGIM
jgi:hypothetical protein